MGEGEKKEEKKNKEEGRREENNPGLEHLLCLEIDIGWFGTYLELLVGIHVWVKKFSTSFFVYM